MSRGFITITKHVIGWMLLLQVINLSIDPVDPVSYKVGRMSLQENFHANDIESIYELICEQFMGMDVPEHDEEDLNGFLSLFMLYFTPTSIENQTPPVALTLRYFFIESTLQSVTPDFISPPPQVA